MFRFYSHNSSFVHGGLDNTGKVGSRFLKIVFDIAKEFFNFLLIFMELSFTLQSFQDAQDAEAAAVYGQQEIHQKIMQVGN